MGSGRDVDAMIISLGNGRPQRAAVRIAQKAGVRGGSNVVRLWHDCPHTEEVTEYDRKNAYLFGLLLQAEADGASPQYMAGLLFNIDADRHPIRARRVVRSHLARAHWLQDNAFPMLDW